MRVLALGAAVAAGGFVFTPPHVLWDDGIHKAYPLEPFWVQDEKGNTFSSDECYQRPIIMITWASWCPWMPTHDADLIRLHDRFAASDMCFLSVSTDKTADAAWAFLRSNPVPNSYWGGWGLPEMFWRVPSTPALYIINRKGYLVYRGPLDGTEYDTLYPLIVNAIVDSGPADEATKFVKAAEPAAAEDEAVSDAAGKLYSRGKLADVESLASGYQASKEKTALETWKLKDVYDGLLLPQEAKDEDIAARTADFEAWISSRPDAILPRVALAWQWLRWAEKIRGLGAYTAMPAADVRLYTTRLGKARTVLETAEKLGKRDPMLYDVLLDVARYQDWPAADQRALYKRAAAFEPLNVSYDLKLARTLEPFWRGSDAELVRFAEEAAKARGADGDAAYAQIAGRVLEDYDYAHENLFTGAGFSWARVRAGSEALMRLHPSANRYKNLYARFASDAGDRDAARKGFDAMGTDYDPAIWGSRKRLLQAQRYAMTGDDGRGLFQKFLDAVAALVRHTLPQKPAAAPEDARPQPDGAADEAVAAGPEPSASPAAPDPGLEEIEELKAQAKELIASDAKELILKRAGDLRASKERTALDRWKLASFYQGLVLQDDAPEAEIKARIAYLEKWTADRTDAALPRIALGDQWLIYAWTARGHGWSSDVTEDGARLFHERLNKARSILEDVERGGGDPYLYEVMLDLARAQGWPDELQRRLYEKAAAFEPADPAYAFKRAASLEPRWGGSDAELSRFAAQAADAKAGSEGDALYAMLAFSVLGSYDQENKNLFKAVGFSAPRARAGVEELIRRRPDCARLKSLRARFATDAGDRAGAAKAFEGGGGVFDEDVWSDEARLKSALAWANEKNS